MSEFYYKPAGLPEHRAIDELIDELGPTATRRLARRFGGQTLYIPTVRALERRRRDQRLAHEAALGVPLRQLCAREALSERQVRRILRRELGFRCRRSD